MDERFGSGCPEFNRFPPAQKLRLSAANKEGGHAVFELEDGEHHDHLFCVKCNRIIEFYDEVIEERQKAIAKANGFEMTDHSLYIYGICNREDCKKER